MRNYILYVFLLYSSVVLGQGYPVVNPSTITNGKVIVHSDNGIKGVRLDSLIGGGSGSTIDSSSVAVSKDSVFVHEGSNKYFSGRTDGRPVFNVKNYGAKGDGITNDVLAIQAAVAAININGGGTLYFPKGTYKIHTGMPGVDPAWISGGSNTWKVINVNTDGFHIELEDGAWLRVTTGWMDSNTAGSGTDTILYFIHSGSARRDFKLNGGKITFETAPAAQCYDCSNGYAFGPYAVYNSVISNIEIDSFPIGGSLVGYTDSNGDQWTNIHFENVKVYNYGGSGHDNWWYVQGGNTFLNCHFESRRTYQSHCLYWGADRPDNKVIGCTFKGVKTSNKWPLHIYGQSGGDIRNIVIQGNHFTNCNTGILMWKQNTTDSVRNVVVVNNVFDSVCTVLDLRRGVDVKLVGNVAAKCGTLPTSCSSCRNYRNIDGIPQIENIGTAGQLLKVNSGATGLEYFTPSYLSGTGTANNIAYWDSSNSLASISGLKYDATNNLVSATAPTDFKGRTYYSYYTSHAYRNLYTIGGYADVGYVVIKLPSEFTQAGTGAITMKVRVAGSKESRTYEIHTYTGVNASVTGVVCPSMKVDEKWWYYQDPSTGEVYITFGDASTQWGAGSHISIEDFTFWYFNAGSNWPRSIADNVTAYFTTTTPTTYDYTGNVLGARASSFVDGVTGTKITLTDRLIAPFVVGDNSNGVVSKGYSYWGLDGIVTIKLPSTSASKFLTFIVHITDESQQRDGIYFITVTYTNTSVASIRATQITRTPQRIRAWSDGTRAYVGIGDETFTYPGNEMIRVKLVTASSFGGDDTFAGDAFNISGTTTTPSGAIEASQKYPYAGKVALEPGSASAPTFYPENDTNTGIFSPGADVLAITTNGTEQLRVNSSGNVGIGNTSPAEKLDVTGNVKFSGALMPGGSAGTSGQVLTSQGAGNAPTWTTINIPNSLYTASGTLFSNLSTTLNNSWTTKYSNGNQAMTFLDSDGSVTLKGNTAGSKGTVRVEQGFVTVGNDSVLITVGKPAASDEIKVTDNRFVKKGMEYAADYSAGYTDRSLVDKGYVNNGTWVSDTIFFSSSDVINNNIGGVWQRQGNTVFFTYRFEVNWDNWGGLSVFGIKLPVPSNFTSDHDVQGTVNAYTSGSFSNGFTPAGQRWVSADVTNDRILLSTEALHNVIQTPPNNRYMFTITGSYQIK